jgi:tetratricopeptide (TPR) repeat protein
MLFISCCICANPYFTNINRQHIQPYKPLVERERWNYLGEIYITRHDGKSINKIDSEDYHSLKNTERLFFQVPGLTLVRIDASEAAEAELKSIDIYHVSEDMETLFNSGKITKVRIVPIVDKHRQIFVRAPIGDLFTYEVSHQLEYPLKLRIFKMDYIPTDFFWEHLERQIAGELSGKADGYIDYLASLMAKGVERSFVEEQITSLPWEAENDTTQAEREYRLAKFYHDIIYARRGDKSNFRRSWIEIEGTGKIHNVKEGSFYEMEPSHAINFNVKGSSLLRISTRFVYPKRISDEVQAYKLLCYEDGLLKEIFYKTTVLDDLEGITLDDTGRPLGRERVVYISVPAGKLEYRLFSDNHLLVNISEYRKKMHLMDSLSESEDVGEWVKKALANVEESLMTKPDDLRALYVKGCCLYLINRYEEALGVYESLFERQEELVSGANSLIFAGVELHLAKLYAKNELYDSSLSLLDSALEHCGEMGQDDYPLILVDSMTNVIRRERWVILNRMGRHLEAAGEIEHILLRYPMDPEARFLKAQALEWAGHLAALGEYEKASKLKPRDDIYSNSHQRFWWDYTQWRKIHPCSKPQGESIRIFDSYETDNMDEWAEAGITLVDKNNGSEKAEMGRERIYFPIPAGETEQALAYCIEVEDDTYIRGLVHTDTSDTKSALNVSIDGQIEALVMLEKVYVSNISTAQPHEFILPIPAGYHRIEVRQKYGENRTFLNLSYRNYRDLESADQVSLSDITSSETYINETYNVPGNKELIRKDEEAVAYNQAWKIMDMVSESKDNAQDQIISAMEFFTKAIYLAGDADPLKYLAYIGRGKALTGIGKTELAISDFMEVINSPEAETQLKTQARVHMADIYVYLGQNQTALGEYIRLLDSGIDNIHIRLMLGKIYILENKLDLASAQYDIVLKAYPSHPEGLLGKAIVEFGRCNPVAAAVILDKLLDILGRGSEKVNEMTIFKVRYLRGKTAFSLGNPDTAYRYINSIIENTESSSPEDKARVYIARWELERMKEAESIIKSYKEAESPDLSHRIGLFNAKWVESPVFYSTDEILNQYNTGYWEFIGDESITDYTSKAQLISRESGRELGDYFLVSDESYLDIRVEGTTLLRLDIRPDHISDDVEDQIDIKVIVEEDESGKYLKVIEGNKPSGEVSYSRLINVTPGRKERFVIKVEAGIHRLKVKTASGTAHIRPYVLHPGAETCFLIESDRHLFLEQPGDEPLDYYHFEKAEVKIPEAPIGKDVPYKELELSAGEYKKYISAYPQDIKAKLTLAHLYFLLGEKADDIASSTYWYNKSWDIYGQILKIQPKLREAVEGFAAVRGKSRWQRIRAVEDSSGHEDIVTMKSEEITQSVRLRKALLPPVWNEGTYIIVDAENEAVFSLSIWQPVKISVRLLSQTTENINYRVAYKRNGVFQEFIECESNREISYSAGFLQPGRHILQFSLEKPEDDQIVMMQVFSSDKGLQLGYTDEISDESDEDQLFSVPESEANYDELYLIRPIGNRKYFVATSKTPVSAFIQGPTQLRLITRCILHQDTGVDADYAFKVRVEYSEGKIGEFNHQFRMELSKTAWLRGGDGIVSEAGEVIMPLATGLCKVTIVPVSDDMRLAVRMYVRVARKPEIDSQPSPPKRLVSYEDIIERESQKLPIYWVESPPSDRVPSLQKYGSLEASLDYGEDVEDEEVESLRHLKLTVRHRYRFEPKQLYHRGTLYAWSYALESFVYGLEESIYYQAPFDIILQSSLRGAAQSVDGNPEAALRFQTEFSGDLRITSDLTYILDMGYAYKKQSLNTMDNLDMDSVSKDIFSVYDEQHDRQIFMENTLWYKPFLDLIVYGKGRIKTNRTLNPTDLDYYLLRFGLKKLWLGRMESRIYYQAKRWMKDAYRSHSRWENTIYAGVKYASWINSSWLTSWITGRYSIEEREFSIHTGLGYTFSDYRMLRDYNRKEMDFEAEKSYIAIP